MPDPDLERLETRHPRWLHMESQWAEIYDVLFDNVRNRKEHYIPKGQDEEPLDYQRRLSLARFKGEVDSFLQRIVGAVFMSAPSRSSRTQQRWGDFLENVDGFHTHIDHYMQDRLFNALGFGFDAVLIEPSGSSSVGDTTSIGFDEANVSDGPDELTLIHYLASQLVDWSIDTRGEFNWVRLYSENVQRAQNIDSPSPSVDVYREIDRKSWRVYEVHKEQAQNHRFVKRAKFIAQGDHNLGIVPVAVLGIHGARMSYESAIRYIYHYDIDMFTDWADLRWDTWLHAHPTLIDYRIADDAMQMPIGPNARIQKNPQHGERAEYLEFPSGATDELRKNIDAATSGIRRLGGMDPLGSSDDPSALGASGRARELSFSVGEARLLRRYSRALSVFESRIFEILDRWASPTKIMVPPTERLNDEKTSYPQDFTSESVETLVEMWHSTRDSINSETYDKALQRKIVLQLLGDIGAEEREEILRQIEENPVVGLQSSLDAIPDEGTDSEPNNMDVAQAAFEELTAQDLTS